MKNYIIILLITGSYLLLSGCTSEQPYYEIPLIQANGKALITGISTSTVQNPKIGDTEFTIYVQFAIATSGDTMVAELLKNNEKGRLQPIPNSKKSVTVDSSLKAQVTYTLQEAQMVDVGDFVVATFAGKTDAARVTVTLVE